MITWKLLLCFLALAPWVLGWLDTRRFKRNEIPVQREWEPPPLRHEVHDIQRKLDKLSRAQK